MRQRTPPLPPLATAVTTSTLGSKSRTKTIRFLSALVYASRLLAFFIGTVSQRSGPWVASRGTVQTAAAWMSVFPRPTKGLRGCICLTPEPAASTSLIFKNTRRYSRTAVFSMCVGLGAFVLNL